jgi:hypothetical protein
VAKKRKRKEIFHPDKHPQRLVRLADGTIINLEFQKISYRFPAKRLDCYCSDLIMREYSRLREKEGKNWNCAGFHHPLCVCDT